MKKILIAAAALATLTGAAGAASAQNYYGPGYGYDRDGGRYDRGDRYDRRGDGRSIDIRQAQLRDRLERGVRAGRITHREADSLRTELRYVDRMERGFRNSGGLTRREIEVLDERLDRVERRLYAEARDGQRYGYGYGDRRW